MKKALLFLLVLAMLLGIAACQPAQTPSGTTATTTAGTTKAASTQTTTQTTAAPTGDTRGSYVDGFWKWNEPVTFSVYAQYFPEYCKDPANLWHYQWIEDKMNVVFDVEGVEATTIAERNTLMLASGELPDLLFRWSGLGGVANGKRYGDEEGLIVPMNDYLTPEIMPNITMFLAENPNYMTEKATPNGNLYHIPEIYDADYNTTMWHWALWYQPEIYKAVGYEQQPQTLEELLDALIKIRDQDPASAGANNVPMGGAWGSYQVDSFVLRAMGFVVPYWDHLEALKGGDAFTGELVFMPTEDNFFEYLKYMNTLYQEKLIEQDYFTLDGNQVTAHAASGYYSAISAYSVAALLPGGGLDVFDQWEMMEPMTSHVNDMKIVAGGFKYAAVQAFFVSYKCDALQREAAFRYVDYAYQNEGFISNRYYMGPEKDVDDLYGFDLTGWSVGKHNFDFMENDLAINGGKYQDTNSLRQGNVSVWGNGGGRMDRRTDGSLLKNLDLSILGGYSTNQIHTRYSPYYIPYFEGVLVDDQYINKMADYSTVLTDYLRTERAKFITGAREVNEEEWGKYKADMEKMGSVEYMEILTKAFDKVYR